jgi:hypothetical protein
VLLSYQKNRLYAGSGKNIFRIWDPNPGVKIALVPQHWLVIIGRCIPHIFFKSVLTSNCHFHYKLQKVSLILLVIVCIVLCANVAGPWPFGTGSGSSDPYLWLTDPDADLYPNLQWLLGCKKSICSYSQCFKYMIFKNFKIVKYVWWLKLNFEQGKFRIKNYILQPLFQSAQHFHATRKDPIPDPYQWLPDPKHCSVQQWQQLV